MKKRLISLILAVCVLLSVQAYAAPAEAEPESGSPQQERQQRAGYTERYLVKYRTPAAKPEARVLRGKALEVAQRDTIEKANTEEMRRVPTERPVQAQEQRQQRAQLSVQAGEALAEATTLPGQEAQVREAQVSESAGGLTLIELDTAVEPEAFAEQLAQELGGSVEYVQPDFLLSLSSQSEYELNLDLEETAPQPETDAEAAETAQPEVELPVATTEPDPSEEPVQPTAEPEQEAMPSPTPETIDTAALMGDIAADIAAAHTLTQGAGVKVAIIDSGMDVTHPDLAEHITDGYDFIADAPLAYDAADPMGQIHATHIAGLITAAAPQAQIMPLKVFDGGFAYTSDILRAIEYAGQHGAQIINCSFGSGEDNPALREVVQSSSALFVCAAGNARSDITQQPVYPAAYGFPNVVSVASLNADMGFSYYSNYGTKIAAFGRDVTSAYPGGGYGTMSGTSVAAGYVSGVAALASAAGATDVKTRLETSSYRLAHLQDKVAAGRMLGVYAAAAGVENSAIRQITVADDFDVNGYEPTPEEGWALFSSLPNRQVAAMGDTTMVLKQDGSVWAWGDTTLFALGNASSSAQQHPVRVPGLTDIVALSAGDEHCLALKADGTVWGWGYNGAGQVSPSVGDSACPIPVPGLSEVKQVSAGISSSAVVKRDGTVVAWGSNFFGQLGNLAGFGNVKEVRASAPETIALKNDGSVWRWGGGYPPDQEPDLIPQPVPGMTGVIQIEIGPGGQNAYAVKQDGSVWTWQGDASGVADVLSSNTSPAQIAGLANIEQVVAGKSAASVFAIDTSGNLWSWGSNSGGQLGNGTKTEQSTPVQISGISNVTDVSTGYEHSVALNSAGQVWVWGQNGSCQLGLSADTTQCLTPAQLGSHINQNPDDLRVLYNRTYQGEDPFAGGSLVPKTNSITHEIDASGNGYIKFSMASPAPDDCYFGPTGLNVPNHVVVEAKLSAQKIGAKGCMEIKDGSRNTGTLFYTDPSGNLLSGGSNRWLAKIIVGQWVHVAVVIDAVNFTKTTYVNGQQVEQDVTVNNISGIQDIRFYMRSKYVGDMLLDDFKIYGGTEPRELEDNEPGLFKNPGRSFYRADYNNAATAFSGTSYNAGSNSITCETESGGNGYIKIATSNPVTDSSFFGVRSLPSARYKVMEVSLRYSSGEARVILEAKDSQHGTGHLLYITNHHFMTSAGSGTYLGTITNSGWFKVAVVIDEQERTYSIYTDEKQETDLPVTGDLLDFSTLRLFVGGTHEGDIHIDNLKIYELKDSASDGVPGVHMQDGLAEIELENGRLEPWETDTAAAAYTIEDGRGSNGGGYVTASGGVSDASSVTTAPLRVAVTVPRTTQYYVWVRSMSAADTPGSFWLGVDGETYTSVSGAEGAAHGWKWKRVMARELKSGRHVFHLCPQQGADSYDTLIVTNDSAYVPPEDINSNTAHYLYEMEEASVTGYYENGTSEAWMTRKGDALASKASALTAHVQGNMALQPSANKVAAYEQTLQIESSGMYAVWVRASVASLSPSAAWMSVNDAEYQSYTLSANYPLQRGQYRWNKLADVYLQAGENSVRLLPQYSDDKFDQLIVTRLAGYTPTSAMLDGYFAADCTASQADAKTVEGITAAFTAQADASAQGGSVLETQVDGAIALPRPQREESGALEYRFDAPETGEYEVYLRGAATQALSNSMWMAIDGQNYWDVCLDGGNTLHWSKVQIADLSAGPHVLKITPRDAGVRLDQVVVRKKGLVGPEGMMLGSMLELEAEDGTIVPYENGAITAGFESEANSGASGGQALRAVLSGADSIETISSADAPQLSLTMLLGMATKYNIWLRASTDSAAQDNIWYSVGGQTYQKAELAHSGASTPGAWKWTKLTTQQLPAGVRTLDFAVCEPGILLDKVLVTSDLGYVPQGGDSAGGYSFETAVELVLPAQAAGSIASAGAERYYKFTAQQQEAYTVSLSPGANFRVYLYQPDTEQEGGYALLASSEAAADGRLSYTLSAGATYYVKVTHASGGTGSYTLSVSLTSQVGTGSFTTDALEVGDGIKVKLTATGATTAHVFKLTYDASYLQLTSLAAQRYEPSAQPGVYDGIIVESVSPGSVVFRLEPFEPVGASWSGLLSIFAFEAVADGQSSLTLETL